MCSPRSLYDAILVAWCARRWSCEGQPRPGLAPARWTSARVVDMNETSKVVIIIGSVRDGRFGPVVAGWVAARAREHGAFEVDVVDLADIELPLALPAEKPMFVGEAYPRPAGMAEADAAARCGRRVPVMVTPEYNHSYPASLKTAIDWHFTQFPAKPVAFVTYGGPSGGLQAVLHLATVSPNSTPSPPATGCRFPTTSRTSSTASRSTPRRPRTPKRCSSSSPGGPMRPQGVCRRPLPELIASASSGSRPAAASTPSAVDDAGLGGFEQLLECRIVDLSGE